MLVKEEGFFSFHLINPEGSNRVALEIECFTLGALLMDSSVISRIYGLWGKRGMSPWYTLVCPGKNIVLSIQLHKYLSGRSQF